MVQVLVPLYLDIGNPTLYFFPHSYWNSFISRYSFIHTQHVYVRNRSDERACDRNSERCSVARMLA
jgi:hypothetical protein